MGTRQTITFVVLAIILVVGYQWVVNKFFPLPPVPATGVSAPQPDGSASAAENAANDNGGAGDTQATAASSPASRAASLANGARLDVGVDAAPLYVGGLDGDSLKLELTPLGGGVSRVWLTKKDEKGRYEHRLGPRTTDPYQILSPIDAGNREFVSFATHLLKIDETKREFALDNVLWHAEPPTEGNKSGGFYAVLRSADGQERLRITKTYALLDKPFLALLTVQVQNLTDGPLTPAVEQDGPLGIHKDDGGRMDSRKLVWGKRSGDSLQFKYASRGDLFKHMNDPRQLDAATSTNEKFLWAASANKYFGAFIRPIQPTDQAGNISKVSGVVAATDNSSMAGDHTSRFALAPPTALPAGGAYDVKFELYFGPKDPDVLEAINPAFADRKQLGYVGAQDVDQSCCTFQPLPLIMTFLLETIHAVVRNYGVAIIVLVLIVRGCLHPLAVFQQKSMYRMQDAMSRIQPKIQAIKEKYADDKTRQTQETMKLWGEENVNPAAPLVGMLPMFIQLPILVALWTALSMDIHLRNAPFDGWWIADLSAPDSFLTFGPQGIEIPLISWMIGPIYSLNILPILMGVTMFLQQKYMPKPSQIAKRELQRDAAERKAGSGNTAEDQLRASQTAANIMSVLFPVMFYTMPSGLTLYWMATNIFGIFESLRIRKQIRLEKEKRDREGPKPPNKRNGLLSRFFKYVAAQAEELQSKADDISDRDRKPGTRKPTTTEQAGKAVPVGKGRGK